MVSPRRDRLAGAIEVDETYIGGERPGKQGRGAEGKTLVAIAVEDKGDAGIGRIRLSIVPDASSSSLTQHSCSSVLSREPRYTPMTGLHTEIFSLSDTIMN
jgi:hypothetical protein